MELRSRSAGYGFAVLSVALACGARLLLDPLLGTEAPYATSYIAVILTALYSGIAPAVVSAVLGGAAAAYFVDLPRGSFRIDGLENQVGFGLYFVVCAVLIALVESQRRARSKAEERRLEAERETTLRSRAEAAEREERNRFEITLASIGDAVIATNIEGRVTFLNSAASRITGWDSAEAAGQPIETVMQLRNRQTNATVRNPALQSIGERQLAALANNTELISRDGTRFLVEDSGAPILNASGSIVGSVVVFRDVTRAKEREAELRKRHRMIDLSHDAIIMTDAARHIVNWNLGAFELYGWTEAEARGCLIGELLQTRRTPDVALVDESLRLNGRWDGELIQTRKDGQEVIVESRQVALLGASGSADGIIEINRDISERKRLEERLREAAKLESLGILAGGIAHDFNNLLTGVLGYSSLLAESAERGSTEEVCAQQIAVSAERAARLTQQMLAYAGQGRVVVEPLDVSTLVRETVSLLEASIHKNIEVRFQFAEGLPLVAADAGQFEQLIMNILINGVEAIGSESGVLNVVARVENVGQEYIRSLRPTGGEIRPGVYVAIEITDTGVGMDEQTLSRIFDPFYSTKFLGRGLGLAAAQGIVRAHKGALEVTSAPGRGSTFRILFPAAVGTALAKEPAAPRLGAFEGTALVIDDEEIVRLTAKATFERLGFAVLTAADGEQGLRVFRARPDDVRIVLLDMTMPGIPPEDVIRGLREIRPNVRILLSSGFPEEEALRRFGGYDLAGFLQKPFSVGVLSEKTAAAMNAEPPASTFASAE